MPDSRATTDRAANKQRWFVWGLRDGEQGLPQTANRDVLDEYQRAYRHGYDRGVARREDRRERGVLQDD